MRKTLEDLYYGNITPSEQQMTPGSEMKKAVARAASCENQLMEQLGEADPGAAGYRSERDVLPMFYLELVSGLRKGELVALLWSDLT